MVFCLVYLTGSNTMRRHQSNWQVVANPLILFRFCPNELFPTGHWLDIWIKTAHSCLVSLTNLPQILIIYCYYYNKIFCTQTKCGRMDQFAVYRSTSTVIAQLLIDQYFFRAKIHLNQRMKRVMRDRENKMNTVLKAHRSDCDCRLSDTDHCPVQLGDS